MSLFDVLDDAADEAVAGRTLDPAAVLERAERPEYRRPLTVVVGHGSPRWRPRRGLPRHPVTRGLVLAAAAVVLLALALAAVPAVQRAAPLPADTPTGAGTVPRTLYTPPQWIPTVTERPISRAVYVVSSTYPDTENVQFADYPIPPSTPWLVGADGGEYRSLPVPDGWDPRVGDSVRAVALSPDGARVAWVPSWGLRPRFSTRLDLADVRTGDHRVVQLTGSGRRGFEVGGLAFSPSGALLAVWGTDVRGPGGEMTSRQVVVVDVRTATVRQVCVLDAAAVEGAAWTSDGALVTGGCDPQPADRDSLVWPGMTRGADVSVGSGLPAAPERQATAGGDASPITSAFQPVVVGSDGRRVDVVRGGDESAAPFSLQQRPLTRGPGPTPVDLGTHAGAVPLAAGRSGVVVTRWDAVPNAPLPGFGRSDVVRVRADGTVDTLSRSADVLARVGAVAADVIDDARPVDGVRPGTRVLDTAWWSSVTGDVVGVVVRRSVGNPSFWYLLGTFVLVAGVRRVVVAGTRRSRRRRGADPDAPLPGLVRWSGVLAVGALVGASFLVPTEAPRVEASGARTPAVPDVVRDQRLVPPRAFDSVGAPRTTSVGVVFYGTVAGREGVYATDAATGALVRLDELPGRRYESPSTIPRAYGLSPNGRWVSDGVVVVDLVSARWEKLPEPSDANSTEAVGAGVVVLDDGRVVRISGTDNRVRVSAVPTRLDSTLSPVQAPAPATVLTDLPDAAGLSPAGPEQVVVRVMRPDQTEPATLPEVYLVDLGGTGTVTPLSTNQAALVTAYDRTTLGGSRIGVTLVDPPATGEKDGRGARLPVAGGVDGVWLTADDAVVLGAADGSDLAVTRTPLADVRAGSQPRPETVIRFDRSLLGRNDYGSVTTARSGAVTVAAEVVATARIVDPPAEPWWAGVVFWR